MAKSKVSVIPVIGLLLLTSITCGGLTIIEKARNTIGVNEKGNNKGKEVEKYLRSTGLGGGYPWCAAWVNYLHKVTGRPTPDDKQAWSPAWFPSERVILKRGVVEGTSAQPGDVFGIYFSSKERIAHVGLIEKKQNGYYITIEGNTNKAGAREGDGVYRKRRPLRTIYKVARWE